MGKIIPVKYTKYQGCGNDYFFIDCISKDSIAIPEDSLPDLARHISQPHYGIGSDGLIAILPPTVTTDNVCARMRIFNMDGSEAEMCGNGIRGFAKHIFDFHNHLTSNNSMQIQTGAGILTAVVTKTTTNGLLSILNNAESLEATEIEVNVGLPHWKSLNGSIVTPEKIVINNKEFFYTSVNFGNPHAVIFVDNFDFAYQDVGSMISNSVDLFPNKVNVEFVQIVNEREINFRVWERGSGETLACGTGACAAVVVGVQLGKLKREPVLVHLKGGDLTIQWKEDNFVYKRGPSMFVTQGVYIYEINKV